MSKFYTVTKEINGREYKAQFNGISAALKAVDSSYIEGSNQTSVAKLAKYLFDNVIVEPKVRIDDFGADKIGTEETKTINGTAYTAQFKGLPTALKALDDSYIEGTNQTSTEKLAEYLFANVITAPKNLTADDFETMEEFNAVISFARDVMQGGDITREFNEVVGFAREVMQGNFRDQKVEKSTKKASKG
jgi:hypothetical protein